MAKRTTKQDDSKFRRRIVSHGEAPVADLIDNPRNWRLHPEHQNRALGGSLRQIGWVQSVMVNQRTGLIVDGHLRVKVAREAGETTVPVIYVDLTDTEERAVLASLDAITSMATTDQAGLDSLIDSIDLGSLDESLADALRDLRTDIVLESQTGTAPDEEEVPEPPADPRTQRGDLWVLGDHLLLCGDSLDHASVDRLVEPGMADLVFTDPPYGVSYEEGDLTNRRRSKLRVRRNGDGVAEIANDTLSGSDLYSFLVASFGMVERSLRKGASFYICAPSGDHETIFRNALEAIESLPLWQCLIWAKDIFAFGRQDYHWRHESVLYGWKLGAGHFFIDDRTQDTVWEIPRPKASRQHPTMKPVALAEKAIANSSSRGAIVLDLFAGSGTVALACEALGRRARMMELDPGYCDVIVDRWEAFTSRKAERRQAE